MLHTRTNSSFTADKKALLERVDARIQELRQAMAEELVKGAAAYVEAEQNIRDLHKNILAACKNKGIRTRNLFGQDMIKLTEGYQGVTPPIIVMQPKFAGKITEELPRGILPNEYERQTVLGITVSPLSVPHPFLPWGQRCITIVPSGAHFLLVHSQKAQIKAWEEKRKSWNEKEGLIKITGETANSLNLNELKTT